MEKQRPSSVTSQPVTEAGDALHANKKLRIDVRQEDDILQHQLVQQLLHGENPLHHQGQQNPQVQPLFQQHKLAQLHQQHQQLPQPYAQIQQSQFVSPRHLQLRQPPAQPIMQQIGNITPVESGFCSRKLMKYLCHKGQCPESNPITYWKKLVEEYFAPGAKERWCVSSYEKRGNSSVSTSQTALNTWRCGICNTHGGKGYEATYETLPRLDQIRFDHDVLDELLFLDMPKEFQLPRGLMLLEHAKVVQKSVYGHLNVIHEGHLRIIFTPELKIMSWEFCSQRHEEYITRRALAPQVNNLLQVAQKYQAAATESGPAGVSNNDAQTICNMFMSASQQLAKSLENHKLNELGLSKRYVRSLQISEVVNTMKDLFEFTNKNNLGPKAGLDNYAKRTMPKLPVQNMHDSNQLMAAASLPNDRSTTKVMGGKQEKSPHVDYGTPGALDNNTPQYAATPNSYQNMLRSSSANQSLLQQEASTVRGPAPMHDDVQLEAPRTFRESSQAQLVQLQHTASFHHPTPQQNNLPGLGAPKRRQGLDVDPQYKQHVLQQLLKAIKESNDQALVQQPAPDTPNANSDLATGAASSNSSATREQAQHINIVTVNGAAAVETGPNNVINSTGYIVPSGNGSSKPVSSNPTAVTGGNAAASEAESFQEMDGDEFDYLNDLFLGELDDGFLWNM